jgi:hypothetical protein
MAMLTVSCLCPMQGHPDTQSCFELQEYGRTPVMRSGDILDGVIVVGDPLDDVVVVPGEAPAGFECECACHWGAD